MKNISLFIILITITISVLGQYGVSSGSLSYVRDAMNYGKGYMPSAATFIVEDFYNYHKHKIEIPRENDVSISIDYNNSIITNENEFILQIGIATQPANLRANKQNKVNVSIVLDVSSSMCGQKIIWAKDALAKFVKSLNDGDYLSIILFNHESWILQPSVCLTKERNKIYEQINSIHASGSTNLNDGMLLGYSEAIKNHSENINSRVIILTDGMTNTGIVEPNCIINNSLNFNNRGIDISTIGIGQSLNFDLLRQLADNGCGSNYFIGENAEDMYKVFNEEIDALLYGIGKNTNLVLNLPKGWEILKCYGYAPIFKSNNSMTINLSNLTASSTRLVLLHIKKPYNNNESNLISVNLNYTKGFEEKSITKNLKYLDKDEYTNDEVYKNFSIAFMAQNLKDAAIANNNNNQFKSNTILENTIAWMKESKLTNDPDFKRVFDIVKLYENNENIKCENLNIYKF